MNMNMVEVKMTACLGTRWKCVLVDKLKANNTVFTFSPEQIYRWRVSHFVFGQLAPFASVSKHVL